MVTVTVRRTNLVVPGFGVVAINDQELHGPDLFQLRGDDGYHVALATEFLRFVTGRVVAGGVVGDGFSDTDSADSDEGGRGLQSTRGQAAGGEVLLNGARLDRPRRRALMAYSGDEAVLRHQLTVEENLMAARAQSVPSDGDAALGVGWAVDDDEMTPGDFLWDVFGLDRLAERPAFRLSRGEHRKVVLALSLMRHVPVLVLDRPGEALDWRSQGALFEALTEISHYHLVVLSTDVDVVGARPIRLR